MSFVSIKALTMWYEMSNLQHAAGDVVFDIPKHQPAKDMVFGRSKHQPSAEDVVFGISKHQPAKEG